MRWRIDRVTVREDGALWLLTWRAPDGTEAVETVHLGVRSPQGCIRTVQRLAGLAAQAGVPVEELTPETLVGLWGSPVSIVPRRVPRRGCKSVRVSLAVWSGVKSTAPRRTTVLPPRMLIFCQRKDGSLVYCMDASPVVRRGWTKLPQEQVDWLVVTGHGDEVLRAVRRELRKLRECLTLARQEPDQRVRLSFSYLRREARRMLSRIQRLIPPED